MQNLGWQELFQRFSTSVLDVVFEATLFPLLFLNSKTLGSLPSGSVKSHKLQPRHIKWAWMQLRSTAHNSMEAVQTVVSFKAAHTCAYLVNIHHWLCEVLSYSRTAKTFMWFQLQYHNGKNSASVNLCFSSFWGGGGDLSLFNYVCIFFSLAALCLVWVSRWPVHRRSTIRRLPCRRWRWRWQWWIGLRIRRLL